MTKWIVFGGAFDPPHLGHLQMAYALHRRFDDHKILVIPTAASPSIGKDQMAPYEHRLDMTKLTFKHPIEERWLDVSALERDLPKPNFTIDTLKYILSLNASGERLKLVMGYDQWETFSTWKTPLKILELADLIVFPRGLENEATSPSSTLPNLPLQWIRQGEYQLGMAKVYFINVRVCNAASRELRATLGSRGYSSWLMPRTLNYIDKMKLYAN
jgi:nicotinate-nucleotide adenylyltransferase